MKFFPVFLILLAFIFMTDRSMAQNYSLNGAVLPNTALSSESDPTITPRPTSLRGSFEGKNYKIQVGFEDAKSELPISISISQNLIDYGQILPTDPIIRTNLISIEQPYYQGHTVQAFENHPLKHVSSGAIIPDTTCDNGLCTGDISQPWEGTLTYGFGYRCDIEEKTEKSPENISNHCLSDFIRTTSFKQFSKEVSPQVIMEGTKNSSAQMTYKVNISGAQATQFYSNQVTYLLIPNF